MSQFESPFLAVPAGDWLCSNDLAFAIFDGFPVSPGHVLVTTRRIVETWFDATDEEQTALMALVKEAKRLLDLSLDPKPDGYNVGFNSGGAAGQTVPHVHIHVIPRYIGDMPDPRGGVRHVIPEKANYLVNKPSESGNHHSLTLATGHPKAPLWKSIGPRVSAAAEIDLLASFIQPSGLDLIQQSIFAAHRAEILIQAEATVRSAMQSEWEETRVTWYLGANSDMSGDLVVASVQKLTRPEGLAELDRQRFDYVVIDEVHHAQAPSYRRVMARLNATFTLGLTATPERTDGVDVASLFDDVLAWQAKRVTEDEWSHEHIELRPLNRDYNPIIVTPHEAPEMVVVGEWVSSID
jgi:diadenosine tetraphosphate (Ap4A) HIT family hydrolase